LRFSVLSSGSSGNATYVESGSTGVLVDAGLSFARLERLLFAVGWASPANVRAVFVTHAHEDHTRCLSHLTGRCGVPVYSTPGVGEKIEAATVEEGEVLDLGGLSAQFFAVPHDSPTCGLRIVGGGKVAAFATDLGEVGPSVLRYMLGVEALVLEANHDPGWLRSGPYPAHLKHRILSQNGHLSNGQAAQAALELAPFGLKDLVLAHLSEKNNSPARAANTVRQTLRKSGCPRVRVRASMRNRPTPWVEVGASLEEAAEQPSPKLFEV